MTLRIQIIITTLGMSDLIASRRRGRCAYTIVAVVLLVATLGVPASPSYGAGIRDGERKSSRLADGFRVPVGAQLVGGLVPQRVVPDSASVEARSPGWSATLWLRADAVSAYNRVAAQASALGMGIVGPTQLPGAPVCADVAAPGELAPRGRSISSVQCEAFFQGAGLTAIVRVLVCRGCVHPVATLSLAIRKTGAQRPEDAPLPAPLPAGTPTAKLSAAQQRAVRDAVPDKGEPFTDRLPASDFPTVVSGTRALLPALAPGCGTGNLFAVLALAGDGRAATKALLSEGSGDGGGPRHTGTAEYQGLTAEFYRYAYYTTLTVVRGADQGTFATVDWCND